MMLDDFDYTLPKKLIAQGPCQPRDSCRLMVVEEDIITHCYFRDIINFLQKGDVLVLNNTEVRPARLHGRKSTGGKIELLLLDKVKELYRCLIKGRVREGTDITVRGIPGTVMEKKGSQCFIHFPVDMDTLEQKGKMPIPPYIKGNITPDLYQTVYTCKKGSVASPTAGLHFTKRLLSQLNHKGIHFVFITLHIGIGTFLPVRHPDVTQHHMEPEHYLVTQEAADSLNNAIKEDRRIIAVGTTCVKTLETVAKNTGVTPGEGYSDLFIYPGYTFKMPLQGIMTNFHLPKSTLFMLVCAYAGIDQMRHAYKEAIKEQYRFYSFGDAMLILNHHV
jgi:S-adenosylmethionine:tRNA ribosyltransferase-isomerase